MFTIKKTGEGYYLATPGASREELGKLECNQLKHELIQIIKPHREISINFKGVHSISSEGLRILKELMRHADLKKCTVRFIYVDPQLSAIISKLTEKKVRIQDEFVED